ncbi:unnamed protein product [Merluccius merluccius]
MMNHSHDSPQSHGRVETANPGPLEDHSPFPRPLERAPAKIGGKAKPRGSQSGFMVRHSLGADHASRTPCSERRRLPGVDMT